MTGAVTTLRIRSVRCNNNGGFASDPVHVTIVEESLKLQPYASATQSASRGVSGQAPGYFSIISASPCQSGGVPSIARLSQRAI